MISKIGAPRVGRGVARVEINSPLEFLIKRETNPSGSGTEFGYKGERKVRNGRTNLWNDHWTGGL